MRSAGHNPGGGGEDMSKEMQEALNTICDSVESGKIMRQALTLAVELHNATKQKEVKQDEEPSDNS